MPLILMKKGETGKIASINCDGPTRTHLMNLGFRIGENIRVVNSDREGIILTVKNVRMALNRTMASKIMVS